MDTKTYAVIDSDGQVLNCIVWDGVIPLPFQDQLVEYTEDKPAWLGLPSGGFLRDMTWRYQN